MQAPKRPKSHQRRFGELSKRPKSPPRRPREPSKRPTSPPRRLGEPPKRPKSYKGVLESLRSARKSPRRSRKARSFPEGSDESRGNSNLKTGSGPRTKTTHVFGHLRRNIEEASKKRSNMGSGLFEAAGVMSTYPAEYIHANALLR